MKKWLVLSLILMAVHAEGVFPLLPSKVPLKTNVKVKSSRTKRKKAKYSPYGVRTSVQKDTTQKRFLSIEVRSMSPKIIRDIKISYQFYELRFEHSTTKRVLLTRRMGSTERLVPAGRGQLSIEQLKPLEKKVVETEPLETSYRSIQDRTKLIPKTTRTGTKFGGYIVEYYVGGELAKVDASSNKLYQAYLRSIQRPGTSSPLRMNIRRQSIGKDRRRGTGQPSPGENLRLFQKKRPEDR